MKDYDPSITPITPEDEKERDTSLRLELSRGLAAAGLMNIDLNEEREALPSVEKIPSLFERGLKGPDSMHGHNFDQSNTVWTKFSEAEDTSPAERTEEQAELIADVACLENYAGYTTPYMDVFTPAELHGLVKKLEKLRGRNRADFNEVEDNINNVILKHRDSMSSDVIGLATKGGENAEGHRPRQFKTLNRLAWLANDAYTSNMLSKDPRHPYVIPIRNDPDFAKDGKHVDLKNIYQFVATEHALEIYGQRNLGAREARCETFLENYDLITAWYKEAKPGIDLLPHTIEFAESLNSQSIIKHRRPVRSGIQFQLKKLIETMKTRRDGKEPFGVTKNYKADPAAAINLQLLIGHKIEAIRAQLDAGIQPSDEKITPLDGLDNLDL